MVVVVLRMQRARGGWMVWIGSDSWVVGVNGAGAAVRNETPDGRRSLHTVAWLRRAVACNVSEGKAL